VTEIFQYIEDNWIPKLSSVGVIHGERTEFAKKSGMVSETPPFEVGNTMLSSSCALQD